MNCEEAQRLISTGWEESEEKAAELTEHLKNCPECKRYAGQMRRLGELLAALPQSEPPRTLAEDAKSLAQKRSAGRKKTVRILTGLAAALVICVAAATWAMLPRAPEQVAMDPLPNSAVDSMGQIQATPQPSDEPEESSSLIMPDADMPQLGGTVQKDKALPKEELVVKNEQMQELESGLEALPCYEKILVEKTQKNDQNGVVKDCLTLRLCMDDVPQVLPLLEEYLPADSILNDEFEDNVIIEILSA